MMSFNLMGLVLTILACSSLMIPVETFNSKREQERFYKYYDEAIEERPNEQKRFKWMAAESIQATQIPASDASTSEKHDTTVTPPPASNAEESGTLKNQEKLLNAVALIRQVLISSHSLGKEKEANNTDLLKLVREVIPVAMHAPLNKNEALANPDYEEVENNEREYEVEEEEDNPERQEKLKRDFWETNKDKFLKGPPLAKEESDKLTSDDELESFETPMESSSDKEVGSVLRKREDTTPKAGTGEESSTSSTGLQITSSVPSPIQSTNFAEKARSFIRRHLWFKTKGKRDGINIRKKRIGELAENIEQFQRGCGDSEVARRDVNGCGSTH